MQRSLLLLSASFLLVACEGLKSPWSSTSSPEGTTIATVTPAASKPVAARNADAAEAAPVNPTRFSWEKDLPAGESAKPATPKETVIEPPKDAGKARVISVREDAGLVALARAEKPEAKSRLQLVKDGKAILVEVIRADDKMIVVGIIPNQDKAPKLVPGDEVGCGVLAPAAPAAQ
jgi:hypothetical protein